jgi:drug/metabolite transporter (DMT)-like permease
LSEIGFAIGAILSKRLLSNGVSPITVNGFQLLFGGMGLLFLSGFCEPFPRFGPLPAGAWGSLVYLTLFGSVIASGIYYWLIESTNPLFPSTWFYVSPVIALFVGALVLFCRLACSRPSSSCPVFSLPPFPTGNGLNRHPSSHPLSVDTPHG